MEKFERSEETLVQVTVCDEAFKSQESPVAGLVTVNANVEATKRASAEKTRMTAGN